jgi:hypothetical protein
MREARETHPEPNSLPPVIPEHLLHPFVRPCIAFKGRVDGFDRANREPENMGDTVTAQCTDHETFAKGVPTREGLEEG